MSKCLSARESNYSVCTGTASFQPEMQKEVDGGSLLGASKEMRSRGIEHADSVGPKAPLLLSDHTRKCP
jgi:hypothetical protein